MISPSTSAAVSDTSQTNRNGEAQKCSLSLYEASRGFLCKIFTEGYFKCTH